MQCEGCPKLQKIDGIIESLEQQSQGLVDQELQQVLTSEENAKNRLAVERARQTLGESDAAMQLALAALDEAEQTASESRGLLIDAAESLHTAIALNRQVRDTTQANCPGSPSAMLHRCMSRMA